MKGVMQSLMPVILGVIGCVLLEVVFSTFIDPYIFSILIYAGINITLAVSLNLVNGLTGQFSMGHAGFMAIGGYVAAFLTTTFFVSFQTSLEQKGIPSWAAQNLLFALALYLGGVAAAVLGFVVGLPSLRLKGDYLAIVTLGFGEIIRVLILNIDAVGGPRGMPGIPKWTNFGWVYFVALLCILCIKRIMASSHGRALLAVREDEIAAEAMGVPVTRYKVIAFVIGAFFAGISGGLFGHFLSYLNPQTFDFNRSFEVITMVVLGGLGSTSGAVLAAVFLTALRELLRPLQEITQFDLRMVIYSFLLIVLMLTRPKGFFGSKELTDYGLFQRFKRGL